MAKFSEIFMCPEDFQTELESYDIEYLKNIIQPIVHIGLLFLFTDM